MDVKPTIGRIVHYHQREPQPWELQPFNNRAAIPAIITEIAAEWDGYPGDEGSVRLTVFPVGSPPCALSRLTRFLEEPESWGRDFWTWPPRE